MTSTHFPQGVTNNAEYHPLGSYLAPSPARMHQWFDDFDSFVAANWTVTETQAGATQAITAGDGGLLALVNSAADDDLNAIQLVQETYRWSSGKQFWLRARFKVSDATESDLIVGAYITDTSPLASLPSDGVFFHKADGSTSLTFQVRKDGTSSSITLGAMANDTFVEATAYWDGRQWNAWHDTTPVGAPITSTTNCPDDEDIAIGMAVQNGEAAAKTLTIDYVLVSKER
jgi:hypothetical protein